MPQKLMDVELDEVSLVDVPANQMAKVVLTKRAEDLVGVRLVLGFPANGSAEVAGVLFSKDWKPEEAKAWTHAHHLSVDKVGTLPEGGLHFEQPTADVQKFRTVAIGNQIAKGLEQKYSFTYLQSLIATALTEHLKPILEEGQWAYIKDLFGNNLICEARGGALHRISYEVSMQPNGDPKVTFGELIPVEVTYQDVQKAMPPADNKDEEDKEAKDEEANQKVKARRQALYARLNKAVPLSERLCTLFEGIASKTGRV